MGRIYTVVTKIGADLIVEGSGHSLSQSVEAG